MNINCRNGRFDSHENGLPEKTSRPEVDYALAAYSLFDEEIEDIRRMSLPGKKEKALLERDPREDSARGGGLGRMVLLEPRSSSETSIGPNPAKRCHPTNPDGRRRRAAFCKKRRAEFDTHEPLKGMHRLWT